MAAPISVKCVGNCFQNKGLISFRVMRYRRLSNLAYRYMCLEIARNNKLGLCGKNFCQHRPISSGTFTNCKPSAATINSNNTPAPAGNNIKSTASKITISSGPSLKEFLYKNIDLPHGSDKPADTVTEAIPYIDESAVSQGFGRKVYFETYGCQMNVNDTEIAWSILEQNGFERTLDIDDSDVILVMTCSIREGAEQKIWKRLQYLKSLKKKRLKDKARSELKIGILGCMAERLKSKILEKEKMVDLICGPDSYRDLPRMLSLTQSGQTAVNVLLSLEETYADVMPVRLNENARTAFVSIMRGCDNMCSYCIVPFTRGRERSRPVDSIIDEVKKLSDQGIKEVTLLGQNVNSYRDISVSDTFSIMNNEQTHLSKGFKTIYKTKNGGRRFADLLDYVSRVDPEMRIRYTSPHPKDFPDEVLHLMKERPNICNQIHLPAQSGNNDILNAMRRGYTREAYLELVQNIRNLLPDVSLSSDFISGFCGETEEAHEQTVELMKLVKYNFAFCFPYSMRGKTHAFHKLIDDAPQDVKNRRFMELINIFREEATILNQNQIGKINLVLVEGDSKRSCEDFAGRNDGNTKVIFQKKTIPSLENSDELKPMKPGDYVAVRITNGTSQVLHGIPLYHTTVQESRSRSISR